MFRSRGFWAVVVAVIGVVIITGVLLSDIKEPTRQEPLLYAVFELDDCVGTPEWYVLAFSDRTTIINRSLIDKYSPLRDFIEAVPKKVVQPPYEYCEGKSI